MRFLVAVLLLLLLAFPVAADGPGTLTQPYLFGPTLPPTCTVGQIFTLTTSPLGLHDCTSTDTWTPPGSGGGGSVWGTITGTLSTQTDLQGALDGKASSAQGVTNGDAHDHAGGDGAQIDHTGLTNIGTNTHAQIDTGLGSAAAHIALTNNPHSTSDANLITTDVTTNDVSIAKHGFTPKAPNQTTFFLRGDGVWAVTPATGIGYTLAVQALTSSPADSATVYFGNLPKAPTTTAAISKVYIPRTGTLKVAEIYCYSGTAGTAEPWSLYVRRNNTTDTLIATLSVSASERRFSNAGLSIAVVAGDYLEIKGIQPLWATNPLTTIYGGYVYIE